MLCSVVVMLFLLDFNVFSFWVVIIECITVWVSVLLLHYYSLMLSCLWINKVSQSRSYFIPLSWWYCPKQFLVMIFYHQHCDNGTSSPFSFAKITWSCSLIQPGHQVGISVFVSFILTNNHRIDIYLCFILFFRPFSVVSWWHGGVVGSCGTSSPFANIFAIVCTSFVDQDTLPCGKHFCLCV